MPKIWDILEYPPKSDDEFEKLLKVLRERKDRNQMKYLEVNGSLELRRVDPGKTFQFLGDDIYRIDSDSIALTDPDLKNWPERKRSRYAELDASHSLVLNLEEPLHSTVSEDRMEQVWKAATLNNLKVVVKIYQGCFQDTPIWNRQEKKIVGFAPEEEQVHREAWAYN